MRAARDVPMVPLGGELDEIGGAAFGEVAAAKWVGEYWSGLVELGAFTAVVAATLRAVTEGPGSGERGPAVVLVGPPGAGKSTVGALLADRLGTDFTDVDELIVARAGRSISDIFTTEGEPVFRELEEAEVATALRRGDGVLALGGGAVLSERTRAALRRHRVAFLSVGMAEGVRRTGLSTARPLLAGINPRATFAALLDARLPLYREVATVEVATDRRSPEDVAQDVLACLGGAR